MLKWTVNGPCRQSYMPTEEVPTSDKDDIIRRRSLANTRRSQSNVAESAISENRRKLRRKSSGHELRRRILSHDKENNLTSTPLPAPLRSSSFSPLRKSLKDVSNITPDEKFLSTPLRTPVRTVPSQYASTLPTFDVEYSPCSVVPGPILALRGMGIADSYFEKPRYLTNEFRDCRREEKPIEVASQKPSSHKFIPDESLSLSSSKMGDMTLERMIDAILESARKERRKAPKSSSKQTQPCQPVMSPSYTAADDPASDLNEFWDPLSEKYLPNPKSDFNEREVRTPELFSITAESKKLPKCAAADDAISCHLRRQRAVRRKRRLTLTSANFIKSTVKSSAQKLFPNSALLRKSLERLVEADDGTGTTTPRPCPTISPDSGRNSPSDLEESTEDANLTKRRLSFSA